MVHTPETGWPVLDTKAPIACTCGEIFDNFDHFQTHRITGAPASRVSGSPNNLTLRPR